MRDMIDGLPVVGKLVAVVGVPSVIALYLVWVLTTSVASASQLKLHDNEMQQRQDAMIKLLETQVRMQRVMCQALATSDAARIECSK